ncbi:MAG: right-handed parallel beta-helix repeat-containing protein [Bacteroidales bacterium]|nr:right-handed parallel beta-helix repeat-containing protein [Bacteroidales bacterium]
MANYISIIPDGEIVDALLTTVQNSNLSATHKITRSATLVIAASDSSAKGKAQADYVCDGINDHITINAAIATLPTTGNVTIPGSREVLEANQGGNILLLEGSYQIAGAIDVSGRSNVTIEGIGPATVIYNTATDGSHAIQAINTGAPKNRVVVKNLTVVGNASSGDGIHLREINYQKVEDVYCLSNGGNGISIIGDTEAGAAENKIITNVQCLYNKLDGLHLESTGSVIAVHETQISNSHFEENYRYNVGLFKTIDIHISNCSIEDGYGTFDLYSENGYQLKITGCTVEGNASISGGTTIISGSEIHHLEFPGSTTLIAVGSSISLFTSTFSRVYLSGSVVSLNGTLTITGGGVMTGCELRTGGSIAINLAGTTTDFSMTGNRTYQLNVAFAISGTPTSTRLLISSNYMRTSSLTISGLSVVQLSNNMIIGSGSCGFSDISDGVLQVSNNVLSNYTITVNATCSLTSKQILDNLGGVINDNSV